MGHGISTIKTEPQLAIVLMIQECYVWVPSFFPKGFDDFFFFWCEPLSCKSFLHARDDRPKLFDSEWFHNLEQGIVERSRSPLLMDARGLIKRLKPLFVLTIVGSLPLRHSRQNQVTREQRGTSDAGLLDNNLVKLRVQFRRHLDAGVRFMVKHCDQCPGNHCSHHSALAANFFRQVIREKTRFAHIGFRNGIENSLEVLKSAAIQLIRSLRLPLIDGQRIFHVQSIIIT